MLAHRAGLINAFADPVTGIAFACTRRRFGFPGGRGPETEGLTAAVLKGARGRWALSLSDQAWPVSKRLILPPPGAMVKCQAVRISPQVSLR